MSNNYSTNDLSTDESVFQVASHPAGQKFVDIFRRNLTGNGNEQRGDFHMARSRALLQMCISMLDPSDRDRVLVMRAEAQRAKAGLNNASASDSGARRYLKAMKYRYLAKEAYKTVVETCYRVVDEDIMDGILEDSQSTGLIRVSTPRDQVLDSHSVFATPREAAIDNVLRVEMETNQSEVQAEVTPEDFNSANSVGGLISYPENAVVVGAHRQDSAFAEILANLLLADESLDEGVTHADYGDWLFSPYSDGEEESEEEQSSQE